MAKLKFAFRIFAKAPNIRTSNFHQYTRFLQDLQLWSDGIQRYLPFVDTEIQIFHTALVIQLIPRQKQKRRRHQQNNNSDNGFSFAIECHVRLLHKFETPSLILGPIPASLIEILRDFLQPLHINASNYIASVPFDIIFNLLLTDYLIVLLYTIRVTASFVK